MNNVVLIHRLFTWFPERYWKKVKEDLSKDYDVCAFDYHTRKSVDEICEDLKEFLRKNKINSCSFVGLSLGSVISRYFVGKTKFNCDRIVAIFPPYKGTMIYRFMFCFPFTKWFFGKATTSFAYGMEYPSLPTKTTLGVIAGNKRIGFNKFCWATALAQLVFLRRSNDGALMPEETIPDCAHERIVLNVNHLENPGKELSEKIRMFLEKGKF